MKYPSGTGCLTILFNRNYVIESFRECKMQWTGCRIYDLYTRPESIVEQKKMMHRGCGGMSFPIKNEKLGIGCLWLHAGGAEDGTQGIEHRGRGGEHRDHGGI